MKKYIKSSLVDTPPEVISALIQILADYGFVLDPAYKENPGRTWMGRVHLQVINPDSDIRYSYEIHDYVPNSLIEEITKLDEQYDCPITWDFGINSDGRATGGLDIDKQYIED